MNIQYHSQLCSNDNVNGFEEFNNLDWELMINGRKLLRNSIRVTGEVVITPSSTVATQLATAECAVNSKVGHHSYFDSWSCESMAGVLETLNSYPRYVNMSTSSSHGANDFFNAVSNAEGKSFCNRVGKTVLQPTMSANAINKAQFLTPVNFSIRPQICFNSMRGGDWSFDQRGYIRISCNLARNTNALFGSGTDGGTKYVLKNVRLEFQTVPEDGKKEKIIAESYVLIKSVVNSSLHNLSAKVASSACHGVAVSYLRQENENAIKQDSLKLDILPAPDSITYLFNSSTQKYLTYSITNRNEMVSLGVQALQGDHHNISKGDNLSSNQGYLTGLPFGEVLDLSNEKVSIQTATSNIGINLQPYNQYAYFLTILPL